ncbi:unnamed protein product [marine sediment metagenome]|jgi:hypothetical protein|uniref:Uncharacterized protein n=1 Tax=marine sediment metagenome TaxID=412755 RepID=X0RIS3_9ZZZZ
MSKVKTTDIKNQFVKMLNRTQQQITDTKTRKAVTLDMYNRDLQQLHKDQERLLKIIDKL